MAVAIAIVIGLVVATGIYWRQNPNVELKVPSGLASQVSTQGTQRTAVPESFAAITATKTPTPTRAIQPTPTKAIQPTPAKETSDSPSVLEKLSRTISESQEERRARQESEVADMVASLERQVHEGINEARVTVRGTHRLQWDDRLNTIARAHSEDMTERGYFSHDNPEGLGPTERAAKGGYRCRKYFHAGLAENITIELMSSDMGKLAAAAVQGWMDSPGHRTNLLGWQYDRTGVGASFGKWKGYKAAYITQVFC